MSCSDNIDNAETFLNGASKSPIAVRTSIGTTPLSRAFDKTFEKNDKLYAYIEAGKMESGGFVSEGKFIWHDYFTVSNDITTSTPEGVGNITSTDDLSPTIYWDDFSSVDYDLRATDVNRGIRVKYGYCYNGGEANASEKNETAGTLTWKVLKDQSAAEGADMKKSDLLYARTEDMVKYKDATGNVGELVIHYTHAMSKITINVTAGEGFAAEDENFKTSVLTLKDMQTVAAVNAPDAQVTVPAVSPAGIADIKTYTRTKENTKATYQAIVAPTNLSAGNVLAHIQDIHGNNYDIPVTAGILQAWSSDEHLIVSEEEIENGVAQAKSRATDIPSGTGYTTKQGVHYILDVTVEKQKIKIRATITDWDAVHADGVAQISFTSDDTEKGTIASELQAKGFDVYKSNSNSSFPSKTTTLTYSGGKWNYNPVIYWAGQNDNSYFRAVSPSGASSSALIQGTDLVWGTSGNTAIAPRTGDVPLSFRHIMSKLCINLKTTDDASKVNLDGATIKITNMANEGSYNIADGTTSCAAVCDVMLSGKLSGFVDYTIPQSIGDAAKVIITLADGTTYSLQLNQCLTTGDTPVTEWLTGKIYTYTITLQKEDIRFRAMVSEWEHAKGSGNATLEWD